MSERENPHKEDIDSLLTHAKIDSSANSALHEIFILLDDARDYYNPNPEFPPFFSELEISFHLSKAFDGYSTDNEEREKLKSIAENLVQELKSGEQDFIRASESIDYLDSQLQEIDKLKSVG